jgi:hypothetical protein
MAEETKKTVGVAELVEFGKYLNELHGTDRTFEIVDASRHMKACSLDDVIASFQAFFDRKTESFKVRITFSGGLMHSTTEFTRATLSH